MLLSLGFKYAWSWLTSGGLQTLASVYAKYKDSADEQERMQAEWAKAQLDAMMQNRQATSGFWEMRVLTFFIALPFVAHTEFSIDQLKRRREEFALLQEANVRLPNDFTTEIPTNEAIWLYKAGISAELARHYGFGFSQSLKRVVLPVYRNSTLIGFTARSTIGAKPKYIEKMANAETAVFMADPATRLPATEDWLEASGPDLVVTEDILSAVRVGRCVRRCCALLGTSANERQLSEVLHKDCIRIAIWLDPDRPGKRAASNLLRRLSLYGLQVRLIKSNKDPKYYSNREIRKVLSA